MLFLNFFFGFFHVLEFSRAAVHHVARVLVRKCARHQNSIQKHFPEQVNYF